eukprot:scaffold368845_cov33-Prasinocladus_malaysianus.AAC.1
MRHEGRRPARVGRDHDLQGGLHTAEQPVALFQPRGRQTPIIGSCPQVDPSLPFTPHNHHVLRVHDMPLWVSSEHKNLSSDSFYQIS